jgi:hypothetical protein
MILLVAGQTKIDDQRRLRDVKWWRRILPTLPVVLGVAIYLLLPLGIDQPWGVKLLMGVGVGLITPGIRKMIKRGFIDDLPERKDD